MAKKAEKENQTEGSIISIIRQMVAAGEKEENIIQTLQDLGIDRGKAQRLLLLGQADTFALLQSEINKMVLKGIEKEKVNIQKTIKEMSSTAAMATQEAIIEKAGVTFDKKSDQLRKENEAYRQKLEKVVSQTVSLTERFRVDLTELARRSRNNKIELDEVKLRGLGKVTRLMNTVLLIGGLLLCFAAFFAFFMYFNPITIDGILITIVMVIVGISMMFVSTLL